MSSSKLTQTGRCNGFGAYSSNLVNILTLIIEAYDKNDSDRLDMLTALGQLGLNMMLEDFNKKEGE